MTDITFNPNLTVQASNGFDGKVHVTVSCAKCDAPPRPEASEAVACRWEVVGDDGSLSQGIFRSEAKANAECAEAMREAPEYGWRVMPLYASPTPLSVDREKDSARLDWLERQKVVKAEKWYDDETDSYPWELRLENAHTEYFSGDTLREAIDAAMSTTDRTAITPTQQENGK